MRVDITKVDLRLVTNLFPSGDSFTSTKENFTFFSFFI